MRCFVCCEEIGEDAPSVTVQVISWEGPLGWRWLNRFAHVGMCADSVRRMLRVDTPDAREYDAVPGGPAPAPAQSLHRTPATGTQC